MAPTVFRTQKVRFVIYTRDHKPPHVHAIKGDFEAEAKIDLESLEVLSSRGFTTSALKLLQAEVGCRQGKLMEVWNEIQSEDKENGEE